jgi:magnesium-transporting ATPase (P-type)
MSMFSRYVFSTFVTILVIPWVLSFDLQQLVNPDVFPGVSADNRPNIWYGTTHALFQCGILVAINALIACIEYESERNKVAVQVTLIFAIFGYSVVSVYIMDTTWGVWRPTGSLSSSTLFQLGLVCFICAIPSMVVGWNKPLTKIAHKIESAFDNNTLRAREMPPD